jgi:hypothetical protein
MDNVGNYINEPECLDEPASGAFALTITKSLQDQYLELFDDSIVMKGKSNYMSTLNSDIDVEMETSVMPRKILEDHRKLINAIIIMLVIKDWLKSLVC